MGIKNQKATEVIGYTKLRVQVRAGKLQSFVRFLSEIIYFNQTFSIVTSFRKLLPKNLLLTASLGLSNA